MTDDFHDTLLLLVRQIERGVAGLGSKDTADKTIQKLVGMYNDALNPPKKDPKDFLVIGGTALRMDSIDAVYPDAANEKCWVKVGNEGVILPIKSVDVIKQL